MKCAYIFLGKRLAWAVFLFDIFSRDILCAIFFAGFFFVRYFFAGFFFCAIFFAEFLCAIRNCLQWWCMPDTRYYTRGLPYMEMKASVQLLSEGLYIGVP